MASKPSPESASSAATAAAPAPAPAPPPPPATATPPTPAPTREREREREQKLVLWIAILASFVAFLDGTVVNVALPAIVDELGGGISTQQWVVDAYLITLGALILIAGSVSDLYGRLRIIRIGLIAFGITSLAVALAPSASVLIIARLLQGAAGALLVPSSLALIMSTYRGATQARAIGIWTSATSGAMIIGPLLGGALVDLASWRWAFAINVLPIAVVLVMLTRLEQRDVRVDGTRIDLPGALLGALGLGGAVYALIEQPTRGWAHPSIWIPATVGVVALACFLWRQAVARQPMMPLSLFTIRNFAWGNIATALIYGALSLIGFLLGVYLQEGAGLTATAAGLASLPIIFMMILLSSRIGALAGRIGPRAFMTAGPIIMGGAALLMLTVAEDFNYWWQVLPGVVLFGFGLAVTVSPLTSAILGAIDTAKSGIASAINNAVSRIAGLVVIALVATIVGGQLDLDGFHRGVIVTAAALIAGGIVSWIGIRNAPTDDAAAE